MDTPYINKGKELVVLSSGNLTKSISNVKQDLPKYWDNEYLEERISLIKNYQHKMLLQFLRMSGVRITEAITLRKKDIDFNSYMMNIRWLKSRKYHNRNVPLHPTLKATLEGYTATMKEDDRVFPITRQRAWQIVNKYLDGSPHQLRHSFAVHWLRSGGEITTLSRVLGHSDINTTMIYLRIVPIDQAKELFKIKF